MSLHYLGKRLNAKISDNAVHDCEVPLSSMTMFQQPLLISTQQRIILLKNSQNGHEDATSDSGAGRPDGHEEIDDERSQTNVVVKQVVRVSRPQPVEVR